MLLPAWTTWGASYPRVLLETWTEIAPLPPSPLNISFPPWFHFTCMFCITHKTASPLSEANLPFACCSPEMLYVTCLTLLCGQVYLSWRTWQYGPGLQLTTTVNSPPPTALARNSSLVTPPTFPKRVHLLVCPTEGTANLTRAKFQGRCKSPMGTSLCTTREFSLNLTTPPPLAGPTSPTSPTPSVSNQVPWDSGVLNLKDLRSELYLFHLHLISHPEGMPPLLRFWKLPMEWKFSINMQRSLALYTASPIMAALFA